MTNQSLANALFYIFFSVIFLSLPVSDAYAAHNDFNYPHFYLGGSIAYGETTWPQLTTDDPMVSLSAPESAVDFGTTWGGFIGYQFDRAFAVEAIYVRYPNTRLIFNNLFSFYYPLTEMVTRTQVYSAIGKLLFPLANARINVFIDAGVAFTRRSDVLAKVTRVAPTFGLGFMCNASRRVIAELGFDYYIGYGKSELRPADDFVPFLFSIYFRLGYRLF